MKNKISVKNFLSSREREAIKNAVHEAELKTAGEIKVLVVGQSKSRLSRLSKEEAVERRAVKEFMNLGIQQTLDRTGVLLMLSLAERIVNVKADKAINEKVDPGTWDTTAEIIIKGIKAGQACNGICEAVEQVGNLLAKHFPIKPDDVNELPDGIELKA